MAKSFSVKVGLIAFPFPEDIYLIEVTVEPVAR